jgi:hypothetical protein
MAHFDDLVKELAEVDIQLQDMPTDAYNERITLHDRQNELRAEIHTIVPDYDHTRSNEEIEVELKACVFTLEGAYGIEINVAEMGTASGTFSATDAATDAMQIDARIESSRRVPQIEQRIDHLRNILDERAS